MSWCSCKGCTYLIQYESIVNFDPTQTRTDAKVWIPPASKRPQIPAIKQTHKKCVLTVAFGPNKRFNVIALPSGTGLVDSQGYIDFIRNCDNKWRGLRHQPIHLRQMVMQGATF